MRSVVFNNAGEHGEVATGSESGWIEPNTAYHLAITAFYGKSTSYPEGCSIETIDPSLVTTRYIFGTNGGICCSAKLEEPFVYNATTLINAGIVSDRTEMGETRAQEASEHGSENQWGNVPKIAQERGFINNDVIVGNVSDSARLSQVNIPAWVKVTLEQIETAAHYGDVLMEVGNEMFLKGGCEDCAEPAKYAEMFVALSEEVAIAKANGNVPQDVRLLFDLSGDYHLSNGVPSKALERRGWLGDAITARPELKTRIEGFTFHPYDAAGETLVEEERLHNYDYDWGLRGLKVDYAEAVELGVTHTNVYATEFGACTYLLVNAECRSEGTKRTEAEALRAATTNYNELLNSGTFPEVKGLWWFEAYPGMSQWYSLFNGWGSNEETKLVTLVSELSLSRTPELTGLSRHDGPPSGGSRVTITGTNLIGTTSVMFGTTSLTKECTATVTAECFTIISDTELEAIAPPGQGAVNVVVTTPVGASPIRQANEYSYEVGALVEGRSFKSAVELGRETAFTIPSQGGTFSLGPMIVDGTTGETARVDLETTEPAYEQYTASSGELEYKITGGGIVGSVEGYDRQGSHDHIIGPLKIACTVPALITVAEVPISSKPGSGQKHYAATYNAECVLAPEIVNAIGIARVTIEGSGPESTTTGGAVTLGEATFTITPPKQWTEWLYAFGGGELRGVTSSEAASVIVAGR